MEHYDALRISYVYWIDWIPRFLSWTDIAALHVTCALNLHWLGVGIHLYFTLVWFRLLAGFSRYWVCFSSLFCITSVFLLSVTCFQICIRASRRSHLHGSLTVPPSHEVPAEMAFYLVFPHLYLFFSTRPFSCSILACTDRITLC
jgi:hypothetical protein